MTCLGAEGQRSIIATGERSQSDQESLSLGTFYESITKDFSPLTDAFSLVCLSRYLSVIHFVSPRLSSSLHLRFSMVILPHCLSSLCRMTITHMSKLLLLSGCFFFLFSILLNISEPITIIYFLPFFSLI